MINMKRNNFEAEVKVDKVLKGNFLKSRMKFYRKYSLENHKKLSLRAEFVYMNQNQDTIINLIINRKDFEEVYFAGNQGSLFFSPTTKGKTFTTIVIGLILAILFIFKDDLSKEKFGILYFVSFLFLLCAVYLSLAINKVSKWKKEVFSYLQTLENLEIYQIKFNNKVFKVNVNNKKETSLWTEFSSAEIGEKFISLEGKFNYMFPKKSMSAEDYKNLIEAVEKNIK